MLPVGSCLVIVGMGITPHPLHISRHAEAPTSGQTHSMLPYVSVPAHFADMPGTVSGTWFAGSDSPWSDSFPPYVPQTTVS